MSDAKTLLLDDGADEKLVRIQHLTDTKENWRAANPILRDGEIAFERLPASENNPVNYAVKVGDGVTPWRSLPYIAFSTESVLVEGSASAGALEHEGMNGADATDSGTLELVEEGS